MADLYVTLISVQPMRSHLHVSKRDEAEVGDRPQGQAANFTGHYGQLRENRVRRTRQDAAARE